VKSALHILTSTSACFSFAWPLQENGDVWGWALSEADYQVLCVLGGGREYRMVHGTFLLSPEGPYKTLQDLWDE
jgi:alcohol dehydrogenase (NADP+)